MKAQIGFILFAFALAGCNTANTSVTAAICTDANTLANSTVALNKNQMLALSGIVSTCSATGGGTVFNNATVALGLINDALLLQQSGLLSDVHIKAEAPDAQGVLRKIKLRWERL